MGEDYGKYEITYTNPEIIKLSKSCRPKDASTKDEMKLWETIYFPKEPQVYFYENADESTKKNSYVVKGDILCGTKIKGEWVFAHYRNPKSSKITSDWVKKTELTHLK